jgi:hypothetical protein
VDSLSWLRYRVIPFRFRIGGILVSYISLKLISLVNYLDIYKYLLLMLSILKILILLS